MSSEGDRIKITSKINSIWKFISQGEKSIDTNEFINDYNKIIVKINEFNLNFSDIVDITQFKKYYDIFIYNIFNLDGSRYTPVFDGKKLQWLQFTTLTGRGLFVKNDTKLASCTNDFITCIITYFKYLNDIRECVKEFKQKYDNDFDKILNDTVEKGIVEIQDKEKFKNEVLSLYHTYILYNKTDEFNKRVALVNESFNPNDIEFYTLEEGKYYQIRIKTNRIIKSVSDIDELDKRYDDQIEYTYKICVLSSTKEEIYDNCDTASSKLHNRIAKLEENDYSIIIKKEKINE